MGGRYKSITDQRIKQVLRLLKTNKIKHETGNDAPLKGRHGDYIRLTDIDSLEEIRLETEALLQKYINASFLSWKAGHERFVGKEEADKCYEYLMKFYSGEFTITDEQLKEMELGTDFHSNLYNEKGRVFVEGIAKQCGVSYSVSFIEALSRYETHKAHGKNGVYERIKRIIKEPIEDFISCFDKGGLSWWVIDAYEKEGIKVDRSFRH